MAERIENQVETPDQKSFGELLTLLQKEGVKTTDGRFITIREGSTKSEDKPTDYKFSGDTLSTGRLNGGTYIEMHATWLLEKKPGETDRKLGVTITVVINGRDGKLNAFSQKGINMRSAYPVGDDIRGVMISDDKIAPENIGQVLLAMRTAANVSIVETKEFARAEKEREATKTRESDTKRKAEEAAMRAKEIETERIKQGELLKRL